MDVEGLVGLGHRIAIAVLIHIDKIIGVERLQLGIGRIRDVHLFVLGTVGPQGLAVEPHGGDRGCSVEHATFHGDASAGITILGTLHREVG